MSKIQEPKNLYDPYSEMAELFEEEGVVDLEDMFEFLMNAKQEVKV
jgi:hypothetical protein